MGGQGGGVLADWIVALAEAEGWQVQATYVAGVAQRTGATLYYIEMMKSDGRRPVFALIPAPGDVDVVLAAEWMEAGRSILRGLVTPDRTTLIASTHRALAVSEKEKPGRGIADSAAVIDAAGIAAKRIIAFDMEALAVAEGSVISAALFGALAGAAVLPFARAGFEAVIDASGRGAQASRAAFAAAFARVQSGATATVAKSPAVQLPQLPETAGDPALDQLLLRIRNEIPSIAQPLVFAGVERLTDYQDAAYAVEYLDRLKAFVAIDTQAKGFALTLAAARALAVAMSYDDPIRIADLKTRASRFARVRTEVQAGDDQIVRTTEFMHPRLEEVLGTMPAGLARAIIARPRLAGLLRRLIDRGRRVETTSIRAFLTLYGVAGLRRIRRRTLRHGEEMAAIASWLALALHQAHRNYALAVEILAARKLVKGYSDTHARGQSKFGRVISAVPLLEARADGGDWLRRLVLAAEQDEAGLSLEGALKTVATLAE